MPSGRSYRAWLNLKKIKSKKDKINKQYFFTFVVTVLRHTCSFKSSVDSFYFDILMFLDTENDLNMHLQLYFNISCNTL